MSTETPDPNRPTPRSPDGELDRQGAQRDPRAPESRPGEERRKPPEVLPDDTGDEDNLDQPGQSGNKDRERSGSTRSRKP